MNQPSLAAPAPDAPRRPGRPPGRRSGDSTTRDRILEAARRNFAAGTYATTTIRAIAADADVNPALVLHYFHSKRDLFAATLRLPLHLREDLATLLRLDPDDIGERMVQLYLGFWQNPATRTPLTAMMRSVVTDSDAAEALGSFLSAQLVGPVVAACNRDQPEMRVSLVVSHLIGIALGRHIVGIRPLANADARHLVACAGPVIQHYLTGTLPAPPAA
ncbi:TetR/AcrR family transcriptional regulator [Streptomyces roseolus]|uniref:TetR/AcrR family transcriptional regulator n=1 Tax=Streptomyces roseolus TaxID=67358 RepID=UPI0037AC3C40